MREEPLIPRETLRALLQEQYGVDVLALEFLPVGDTHSAIYRVVTDNRPAFLLKLRDCFDDARLGSARFLHDHDIDAVIAPVPTTAGMLSAPIDGWTAVLFPFVEGETGWDTMTSAHWEEAGRVFRRIHSLQVEDFRGIHREIFDAAIYASNIQELEAQLAAPGEASTPLQLLQTAWRKHHATIQALIAAMGRLATALKTQAPPLVICHADLHPGNLLRDARGGVFVIDWDDVLLAPKERDFIFTGEPAVGTTLASPFFDGYGPTDVNWTAVTYYRYERVVTDFIEYTRDVFRDSLSEAAKLHSIESFVESLEGRNFAAAEVAAEHLPHDLADCFVRRGA